MEWAAFNGMNLNHLMERERAHGFCNVEMLIFLKYDK